MLTKHLECASAVLGTLCTWSQCYRKDPEKRFNVCWNSLNNQLLYTFSLLFSRAEISLSPFFKPRVPDSMLNMLEILAEEKGKEGGKEKEKGWREQRNEGRREKRERETSVILIYMKEHINAGMYVCMRVLSPSVMSKLFAIPWTVSTRLFYPWGFSRHKYEAGCHFLLQHIYICIYMYIYIYMYIHVYVCV